MFHHRRRSSHSSSSSSSSSDSDSSHKRTHRKDKKDREHRKDRHGVEPIQDYRQQHAQPPITMSGYNDYTSSWQSPSGARGGPGLSQASSEGPRAPPFPTSDRGGWGNPMDADFASARPAPQIPTPQSRAAFAPPSGPPPAFPTHEAAPPAFPTHEFAPAPGQTRTNAPPPSGYRIPLNASEPFPQTMHGQAGPVPFKDLDGSPVFVGSALLENPSSVHPCKIVPALNPPVRVAYGGSEREHKGRYDLLPITDQMEWVSTSGGRIPGGRRPVEGGYEDHGGRLYHAYAIIEGVSVPGKTGEHLGGANVSFGGREYQMKDNYWILCWKY